MKKGAHVSLMVGVKIRAPAAAVKAGRDRGTSVTHRRAKEQAAEAAAAEQKKAKKPSTKKAGPLFTQPFDRLVGSLKEAHLRWCRLRAIDMLWNQELVLTTDDFICIAGPYSPPPNHGTGRLQIELGIVRGERFIVPSVSGWQRQRAAAPGGGRLEWGGGGGGSTPGSTWSLPGSADSEHTCPPAYYSRRTRACFDPYFEPTPRENTREPHAQQSITMSTPMELTLEDVSGAPV